MELPRDRGPGRAGQNELSGELGDDALDWVIGGLARVWSGAELPEPYRTRSPQSAASEPAATASG